MKNFFRKIWDAIVSFISKVPYDKWLHAIAGLVIGVIAAGLAFLGNPKNMGFCIACFLRDTAGGLGLHKAPPVQYIRPEIIGIVIGAFVAAFAKKEFGSKGGSAPMTRFVLGFFAMVGCLMFLGCPFRMILRLAGGDMNALLGLVGFVIGIFCRIFCTQKPDGRRDQQKKCDQKDQTRMPGFP